MKNVASPEAARPAWPASLYASPRVPILPQSPRESLVAEDILEGCRRAIQQLDLDSISSIGITSAVHGEGRTSVALAVALALAEYGLNPILVELDFAQPELGQRLGVVKTPGLADLAEGRANLNDILRSVAPGLVLIPAGVLHGSGQRALRQLATIGLVEKLSSEGHVVVADLPPLLGNSVGRLAVSLVADLILVVRAGVVPVGSIKEAINGLPVEPKVLLNGTHSNVPSWALRLSGI